MRLSHYSKWQNDIKLLADMFDAEVITKSFVNIYEGPYMYEANAALECQRNGDIFKWYKYMRSDYKNVVAFVLVMYKMGSNKMKCSKGVYMTARNLIIIKFRCNYAAGRCMILIDCWVHEIEPSSAISLCVLPIYYLVYQVSMGRNIHSLLIDIPVRLFQF